MGMFKKNSYSSHDKSVSIFSHWLSGAKTTEINKEKIVKEIEYLPNPKSDNYKILRDVSYEQFLIIEIQYLDCVNYEGKKILVFENCTMKDLFKQKLIDPHFSENKNFHSPIARFEPTVKGWTRAQIFVQSLI